MTIGIRRRPVSTPEDAVDFINGELLPWMQSMAAVGGIVPQEVTSDVTLNIRTDLALVDASSGPVVVTLPNVSRRARPVRVVKVDATGNSVTVQPVTSGGTLAAQYDSAEFWSDGEDYWS